jgi:glutathione synthase/RimK-type ligase-like ATP-grasp enzyme
MKVTIVPYKGYSQSAKRLRDENPTWGYNSRKGDILVNFGSSSKRYSGTVFLNHPDKAKLAINKLYCFRALQPHVNVPRFTTSRTEAQSFSRPVYERHLLCGTQGKGIIVNNTNNLNPAKLYVEGLQVKREYRVIVIKEKIITSMIKVPRHSRSPDYTVRNLSNGWRFSYKTPYINELYLVNEEAIKAIKAIGLQFGAVDLIVTTDNKIYTLEVNTAFGLGKRNIKIFSDALNEYITELKEKL